MEKNNVLYEVVLIWTEEEQECGYREEERVVYTTTNREKAEQFINENKKFCGYYVYPGLFGDINEELFFSPSPPCV